MGMTITEKILARAAGRPRVLPGDNLWVAADILMTHDVCGPGTIGVFHREFGRDAKVWDRDKVVIIPDHYIFTADEKCHRNVAVLREFVREQNLPHFYDPGTPSYSGVCHLTLPEKGHIRPGEVIFGTDSHTCTHGALGAFATGIGNTDAGFVMGAGKLLLKVPASILFRIGGELPRGVTAKDLILRIIGDLGVEGATYCAMEFAGPAVTAMSIEERMTLCNMAIEAGAKNGIVAPDCKTEEYVRARTSRPYTIFASDPDAAYREIRNYDASGLVPVVALPFSPDKVQEAAAAGDIHLDRAYLGSCTGGKIGDFVMAAEILRGRQVKLDTFLVPATVEVERAFDTVRVGGQTLRAIFRAAGCQEPAPPSCAACLGGPPDTYGRCNGAETCISTTNRNFPGRMGGKDSRTILASPYTVAAAAVAGKIIDPRELL